MQRDQLQNPQLPESLQRTALICSVCFIWKAQTMSCRTCRMVAATWCFGSHHARGEADVVRSLGQGDSLLRLPTTKGTGQGTPDQTRRPAGPSVEDAAAGRRKGRGVMQYPLEVVEVGVSLQRAASRGGRLIGRLGVADEGPVDVGKERVALDLLRTRNAAQPRLRLPHQQRRDEVLRDAPTSVTASAGRGQPPGKQSPRQPGRRRRQTIPARG